MTEENKFMQSYIFHKLQLSIQEAKDLGFVIEVNIEHKTPLVMGNYEMVPSIRQARKIT